MFQKVTLQDWESLVKKQLKTENIKEVLVKENLESIDVKPYYSDGYSFKNLPKVEESTHLVAKYQEDLHDDVFAFFIESNVENLQDKTIFVEHIELAKNLVISPENKYFSLVDLFPDTHNCPGGMNDQLGNVLLERDFVRNMAVNVSIHQNSGASIIQQLAFALGKSKDLVEIFGSEILKKLVFKFAIGSNYFFEIAKIRAFKLLYNQLSKEFGLDEIPYIFAETSLRNKTKNDEENNLIRSTLEISAAMIAGSDAVFVNDYKMQNSTTLSQEISFKQQIVLAYESIINVFDDAANGSFFVENITQQLCEKSWKLFLEIEEKGGYLAELQKENIAKMIYKQAISEQNWVETGKTKLIGVNLYPKLEKTKSAEEMYSDKQIKAVRLAEMFE